MPRPQERLQRVQPLHPVTRQLIGHFLVLQRPDVRRVGQPRPPYLSVCKFTQSINDARSPERASNTTGAACSAAWLGRHSKTSREEQRRFRGVRVAARDDASAVPGATVARAVAPAPASPAADNTVDGATLGVAAGALLRVAALLSSVGSTLDDRAGAPPVAGVALLRAFSPRAPA